MARLIDSHGSVVVGHLSCFHGVVIQETIPNVCHAETVSRVSAKFRSPDVLGMIMGPALLEYEADQAAWNENVATQDDALRPRNLE